MAKLNTYIIHAKYSEENESDDGPILGVDHECRLRVKAGDITEAIKVAETHIGTRYNIDSANANGGYVNIF